MDSCSRQPTYIFIGLWLFLKDPLHEAHTQSIRGAQSSNLAFLAPNGHPILITLLRIDEGIAMVPHVRQLEVCQFVGLWSPPPVVALVLTMEPVNDL